MSNMQAFYRQLQSAPARGDAYHDALSRLTCTGLAQVRALKLEAEWGLWGAEIDKP